MFVDYHLHTKFSDDSENCIISLAAKLSPLAVTATKKSILDPTFRIQKKY